MPRVVGDQDLEKFALADRGYVAVLFFDYTSEPCRIFRPEWYAVAAALPIMACFELEASENPSLTGELGVTAVPTVVLFHGGSEKKRFEGPYSREALTERIKAVFDL